MTKADIVADIAVETGLERVEALKAVEDQSMLRKKRSYLCNQASKKYFSQLS